MKTVVKIGTCIDGYVDNPFWNAYSMQFELQVSFLTFILIAFLNLGTSGSHDGLLSSLDELVQLAVYGSECFGGCWVAFIWSIRW
jgi:hypothetical protein